MSVDLVVMAAGAGSRFGGLKQLVPVGPRGETLTDYAVYDAWRAGVRRAVFVVRREMEREFHEILGRRYASRLEVVYAHQELADIPSAYSVPAGRKTPWGTGHAVLAARGKVLQPFIAINADDWYGAEGFSALVPFLSKPAPARTARWALIAFKLRHTLSPHGAVARGVCDVSTNARLRSVTEFISVRETPEGISGVGPGGAVRQFTGTEPVSLNLWGFSPEIFDELSAAFVAFLESRGGDLSAEFYLPAAVDAALRAGRAEVSLLPTEEEWFGVTYREDLPRVRAAVAARVEAGLYPSPLWC
ncbi:MAG: NTP transferase domain-containing protein [Thermoanaerobaculia bacterium]